MAQKRSRVLTATVTSGNLHIYIFLSDLMRRLLCLCADKPTRESKALLSSLRSVGFLAAFPVQSKTEDSAVLRSSDKSAGTRRTLSFGGCKRVVPAEQVLNERAESCPARQISPVGLSKCQGTGGTNEIIPQIRQSY